MTSRCRACGHDWTPGRPRAAGAAQSPDWSGCRAASRWLAETQLDEDGRDKGHEAAGPKACDGPGHRVALGNNRRWRRVVLCGSVLRRAVVVLASAHGPVVSELGRAEVIVHLDVDVLRVEVP